ncbi:hypothetical protein CMUS01_03073 [Colletotrichum musicola]|uniref:Uncharacterized protein n=1 Tax=Colletotrichum musicola TaxID=2175873 RepID=A0A8H6U6J4_9PEZI|nr:hypothetical protein CMUS01_03073 [Colletotrichum musicola]
MPYFLRRRKQQKDPPLLPDDRDNQAPSTTSNPLPPIRNFSYPTAALYPSSFPLHPASLEADTSPKSRPEELQDAQSNNKTAEAPGGADTPFYWASSYTPPISHEERRSGDIDSSALHNGPEAFAYESGTAQPKFHDPFRHKAAKSVDLSFTRFRSQSPSRPASSSGVADIDTRTTADIALAGDEEDNHPGTRLEASFFNMNNRSLRRVASELSLRMSPPKRMFSHQSQASDYSPSTASTSGSPTKPGRQSNSKSKKGKAGWLHQVKDWFSTGEPSAQDWKQLKKNEFQKHGVAIGDPEASAKLHAPIGAIPEEAIKPSSGPDPEVLAKKRAVNRKQLRRGGSSYARTSASLSSESSLGSPGVNPIAPWA